MLKLQMIVFVQNLKCRKWLALHEQDVMIDESRKDVMTDVTVRRFCASR